MRHDHNHYHLQDGRDNNIITSLLRSILQTTGTIHTCLSHHLKHTISRDFLTTTSRKKNATTGFSCRKNSIASRHDEYTMQYQQDNTINSNTDSKATDGTRVNAFVNALIDGGQGSYSSVPSAPTCPSLVSLPTIQKTYSSTAEYATMILTIWIGFVVACCILKYIHTTILASYDDNDETAQIQNRRDDVEDAGDAFLYYTHPTLSDHSFSRISNHTHRQQPPFILP